MNFICYTSHSREGVTTFMSNNGIVNIHGKEYMTVARRVELAHTEKALESVETEILSHNPVVVKAKVMVRGELFTGISSVNLDSPRQIEKQNPYEVAETSAVGRALGFAGYGLIESIASADELMRANSPKAEPTDTLRQAKGTAVKADAQQTETNEKGVVCEVCGERATEKKGTTKGGKAYHGIFCSTEDRSHTRWLWN
jgi:hypothetical protein